MKYTNDITEFILLGLSQNMKIKHMCFLLFLFCYIAIWMGNLLIMISITCSQLNGQPMHFFLNYLALLDLCYTSTVTPKLVTDLLAERSTISYTDCMAQLFAMHFFGGTEISDHPLWSEDGLWPLYCATVSACCTGAFLHSFVQGFLTINLPFCCAYEIDHYFCDVYPWLKLACMDTYGVGILVVANAGMMVLVIFVVVMLSYIFILYTIKAYPTESRYKALSTCIVVLFFVPILFTYIRPATTFPEDKVFALFYTIIAPMFNPLIYTLRNAEMKSALRTVWCQKLFLIARQII
uniref:G-protein coupled receptors family 1 profile domain-containing protein n=1 Tax=Capra hircus TaxID=9925 RepID=A0A8C2NGP3_CAPHI